MVKGEEFIEKDIFKDTYLLKLDKDKYILSGDTGYTTYSTVYNKLVSKVKTLLMTDIKTY